jgi:tetratricopeptide (TPR) repeat protein
MVSRKLGWHEDALRWFFVSGNSKTAAEYARAGGFPLSAEAFDSLVQAHFHDELMSMEEWRSRHTAFILLLGVSAAGLPADRLHDRVERFFGEHFGRFMFPDHIPPEGLELLLRARAASAIASLLAHEIRPGRALGEKLKPFLGQLSRSAAQEGDAGLLACDALAADLRRHGFPANGYEEAVAGLPLTLENYAVLGLSRNRYREAVELLMSRAYVDEADHFCRFHKDYALAASYAEKRSDFEGAVKYYREARDLDGAMRCAQATGDERRIARVHEWRGEFADALRIWKKLGRKADVARLLKKRPLLKE